MFKRTPEENVLNIRLTRTIGDSMYSHCPLGESAVLISSMKSSLNKFTTELGSGEVLEMEKVTIFLKLFSNPGVVEVIEKEIRKREKIASEVGSAIDRFL